MFKKKGRDSKERSGREGPGKGGTARVARNKVQVESGSAAAGHQGRRPLQLPERQLFMRGNCLRELSAVEEKWLEGVAEESPGNFLGTAEASMVGLNKSRLI